MKLGGAPSWNPGKIVNRHVECQMPCGFAARLLTLGNTDASIVLLSLNRSLIGL